MQICNRYYRYEIIEETPNLVALQTYIKMLKKHQKDLKNNVYVVPEDKGYGLFRLGSVALISRLIK